MNAIEREKAVMNAVLILTAIATIVALACGRTPTEPPPCLAERAIRVDTLILDIDINGVPSGKKDTTLLYTCR